MGDKCIEVLTRKRGLLLGVTFLMILALNLFSLMRYPPPFVDEAWNVSRAWAYLNTGQNYSSMDYDFIQQYPGYWRYYPLIPTWMFSLSFVAGPSLSAARFVSLLFGMVLLVAMYVIGRHLGGWIVGFASVILTASSLPFIYSSHLARPDIMMTACGFWAIAFSLNRQVRFWWVNLLGGLCGFVAFEIHPNGLVFVFALAVIYIEPLLENGRAIKLLLQNRCLLGFLAGCVFGLIMYLGFHLFPNYSSFFAVQRTLFSVSHTPPILTFDLLILLRSFVDMGQMLSAVFPIIWILFAYAFIYLFIRPCPGSGLILRLNVAVLIGTILWVRNKMTYYAILVTPALEIMLVMAILNILRKPWRRQLGFYIERVLVIGLVIAHLLVGGLTFVPNYGADYQRVLDQISKLVAPNERILGVQTYWFGLYSHEYDSWEELAYYQWSHPGVNLEETLTIFRPDIFILDGHLERFLSDDIENVALLQSLHLSRRELALIFEKRGELLLDLNGGTSHGRVRVYRLHWSDVEH
jgi:hypothetical protein